MTDDYQNIIDMPHHVSVRHAPMSMEQRAAQFSPFAALTGYDDRIREATDLNPDNYIQETEEIEDI